MEGKKTSFEEYELLVKRIVGMHIRDKDTMTKYVLCHQKVYIGKSGHKHQVDLSIAIEFSIFKLLVIIECKHYSRPVGIDEVLELAGRLEDIGAHKGVIVTTVGFQRGAVKLAKAKGIALAKVVGCEWLPVAHFYPLDHFEQIERARAARRYNFKEFVLDFAGALPQGPGFAAALRYLTEMDYRLARFELVPFGNSMLAGSVDERRIGHDHDHLFVLDSTLSHNSEAPLVTLDGLMLLLVMQEAGVRGASAAQLSAAAPLIAEAGWQEEFLADGADAFMAQEVLGVRPRRLTATDCEPADLPSGGEPELPPVNLLRVAVSSSVADKARLSRLGDEICIRCAEFGVGGTIEGISPGPLITMFEFKPALGTQESLNVESAGHQGDPSHLCSPFPDLEAAMSDNVARFTLDRDRAEQLILQDDLRLAFKSESVRIERLSGRSTLGIEVPNRNRGMIRLGSLLADKSFRKSPSALTVALGTTIYGEPYYADLATMPHLLVVGPIGAGKSAALRSVITSILYRATRDQVQFILLDTKGVDLVVYADIPHLKAEVVIDAQMAANALCWVVGEMERRYRLLGEVDAAEIASYNRAICDRKARERLSLSGDAAKSRGAVDDLAPLPYLVVVIDELDSLMNEFELSSEVESSIRRLAQMASAVGIHLIVAMQHPSVGGFYSDIKANFPCRISFASASRQDSLSILGQEGAEKLLGPGDILMMPPGSSRVLRLHGAYVSDQETASLVRWLEKQGTPDLDPDVARAPAESGGSDGGCGDELYAHAARLVVAHGRPSPSFLQRYMRIGFTRAEKLIETMERNGLVGPPQGSKPREVLAKAKASRRSRQET